MQRNAVAADAQQRAENEHASSSEDELRNEIETKLRRESQAMQEEFRRTIAIALNRLRSSLLSIRQQQQFLYGEANALRRDAENFFSETQKKIVGNVNLVMEELQQQQQQRNGREMSLRRKKFINIDDDDDKDPVELPGNVRVFCRICPVISTDVDTAVVIIDDDSEDESTLLVTTNNGRRRLQFSMDRVFGQRSTQEEIFHDVQPLISSVIDGHNVGILSYGQKGSGKTFTMMGNNSNSNWGISQRAIQFLFNVTNGRKPEWSYTISVSMLEIDDEKIR